MKRVIASSERSGEDLISSILFHFNEILNDISKAEDYYMGDEIVDRLSKSYDLAEKARAHIDWANAKLARREMGNR